MRQLFLLCLIAFAGAVFAGCSENGAASTENSNAATAAQESQPPLVISEITDAATALAEGNRLLDANLTEQAITALNRAVELDPDLGEAHFKLGIALSLIEAENAEVADGPETVSATENKGKDEPKPESVRSFERAVTAYKKQIDKNGDDHAAHFNLGRAYNKLNQDEDAAKSLKQAVKLNPDDTEYQTELGAILIKLAKYHDAVGPLKKALELDPANSRAEELLQDAEAGRKRIGFSTKKDDRKEGKSPTSANSNSEPKETPEAPKPTPDPPAQPSVRKPAAPANKVTSPR